MGMIRRQSGATTRCLFDSGYCEIAAILGKSEAACRQLVSRARKPRHFPTGSSIGAGASGYLAALVRSIHWSTFRSSTASGMLPPSKI